ncbi:MAG: putative dsRNA-binding protein, partial [Weissella cibaria]
DIMFNKIDEGFYDRFVDYKSKLQEHLQRHGSVKITYTKLGERPVENNEQIFTVQVAVNDQVLATGEGKSTKEAEKVAARAAYQTLTKN